MAQHPTVSSPAVAPASLHSAFPSYAFSAQPMLPSLAPSPGGMMGGGWMGQAAPVAPSLDPAISIELENAELWRQFHRHTTEMIVNKLGRRMFPTLRFNVRGLEEKATYAVYLDLGPLDDHRYKYSSGRWTVNGRADPLPSAVGRGGSRWYLHPDGPAPGALWMRQPLAFHRLKLTNNILDPNGNVLLNSMHKYQPRLYVVKLIPGFYGSSPQVVAVSAPPETAFVTVTAYQNDKVIELKVAHNPFAKGFRDSGLHAEKRRGDEASPEPKREKVEIPEEPIRTPDSTSSGGPSDESAVASSPRSSAASHHSFSAEALASPPSLAKPLASVSSPPSLKPPMGFGSPALPSLLPSPAAPFSPFPSAFRGVGASPAETQLQFLHAMAAVYQHQERMKYYASLFLHKQE